MTVVFLVFISGPLSISLVGAGPFLFHFGITVPVPVYHLSSITVTVPVPVHVTVSMAEAASSIRFMCFTTMAVMPTMATTVFAMMNCLLLRTTQIITTAEDPSLCYLFIDLNNGYH